MGSRRYPGRRRLNGRQLTAVVGVAGALALAGCGGSSGGQQQRRRRRWRHHFGHRLGHLGQDRVVGEPDRAGPAPPTPGRC